MIDTLSVVTQGFLETAGAVVASPRDQLRIATNGWILLLTIDPGLVICVEINNGDPTDFEFATGRTDALAEPANTGARIDPNFTFVSIESSSTAILANDEPIDARFSELSTVVDVSQATTFRSSSGETTVDEDVGVNADIKSGDSDFDPQDQC